MKAVPEAWKLCTHTLANATFDAVAQMRLSALFTDRDTDSGLRTPFACAYNQDKHTVGVDFAVRINVAKLVVFMQSVRFRQH